VERVEGVVPQREAPQRGQAAALQAGREQGQALVAVEADPDGEVSERVQRVLARVLAKDSAVGRGEAPDIEIFSATKLLGESPYLLVPRLQLQQERPEQRPQAFRSAAEIDCDLGLERIAELGAEHHQQVIVECG
jgi:hypothetical protein